MFRSFRASRRLSNPSHASQGIPLNDSVLQLKGSRGQGCKHREVSSTTSLTGWSDTVDVPLIDSTQEPRFTAYDGLASAAASVNSPTADQNMLRPRFGLVSVGMLLLALYSTALSGVWFIVAIIQPRWGFNISTTHGLSPANAATLTALLGKTIEIASAAVFVSCIGQALTRRAVAERSTGITLADITIRNWVIQPGFLFTHCETLVIAGRTFLGALALMALVATVLFTTASEALVSPKLKYGEWESRELTVPVHSYYGNHVGAGIRCLREPNFITSETEPILQQAAVGVGLLCLGQQLKYHSTRDLLAFIRDDDISSPMQNTTTVGNIPRTAGHTILDDRVAMKATRVDTEFSDVVALYERWGRIIDNVTVSIPHPSVWSASRFPENKILQPEDLSNAGGFSIKAAVVSPTLNTLCVNMDDDELTPLVYTEFPNSKEDGFETWAEEEITQWHNTTIVDDVFRWGSKYRRRRPVFEQLPEPGAIVYHHPNSLSDGIDDAGYLVFVSSELYPNYTLCQMRSWLSTNCSTHLEVSGAGQPVMYAHCGYDDNVYRYDPSVYKSPDGIKVPQLWPIMLDIWKEAVALEKLDDSKTFGLPFMISAGTLSKPEPPSRSPTSSEYLSVLLLSTLSLAAVDTQLRHTWNYGLGKDFDIVNETSFGHYFNTTETFYAGVRSQQYTSGHTENWQRLLYLVLGIAFALNLLCLGYLVFFSGMVSDITEPHNHFYLAMNSPPCSRVDGRYPDQLDNEHLKVSWRVTESPVGGGYQFDKCNTNL